MPASKYDTPSHRFHLADRGHDLLGGHVAENETPVAANTTGYRCAVDTHQRIVGGSRQTGRVVIIEDVRAFASTLPRAYEVLVRDRVKFRVGRIVFLAFSRDETIMGFGFPKEERAALVAAEPDKFLMPSQSDLRYHWVHVRLAALDLAEMEELVLDAWRMCVPKRVAAAYPGAHDANGAVRRGPPAPGR
jgi:hypothetical protein